MQPDIDQPIEGSPLLALSELDLRGGPADLSANLDSYLYDSEIVDPETSSLRQSSGSMAG